MAAFSKDETLQSISENDPILCLLDAADLSDYEKSFTNAGITKISHFRDVRCEEDLQSLGLNVFESRRVLRKFEEVNCKRKDQKSIESGRNKSQLSSIHQSQAGLIQDQTSSLVRHAFQDKAHGYIIPEARTEMGLFYNKTLKSFYEECSSFISSKKEFKKRFHQEARREYDLNKQVKKLSEKLSHFRNASNPASAACFLNEDYEMRNI